jgi:glyoxylase-like metal-dependent hydrolase (beta-lactamase superfamily II)
VNPRQVKFIEVAPQVYQIRVKGANAFLLANRELTLIDTGLKGSSPIILDFLNLIHHSVEEITLILISHHHWDHVGSLAELKLLTKAKVAIHKRDIDNLPYPPPAACLLRHPPFSAFKKLMLASRGLFDILLEGGEVLGGLEIIHTPGHTLGSISFFHAPSQVLIVGDALNNRWGKLSPPPKLSCVNHSQAKEAIKKIADLNFHTLCFGHGKPLSHGAGERVKQLLQRF